MQTPVCTNGTFLKLSNNFPTPVLFGVLKDELTLTRGVVRAKALHELRAGPPWPCFLWLLVRAGPRPCRHQWGEGARCSGSAPVTSTAGDTCLICHHKPGCLPPPSSLGVLGVCQPCLNRFPRPPLGYFQRRSSRILLGWKPPQYSQDKGPGLSPLQAPA